MRGSYLVRVAAVAVAAGALTFAGAGACRTLQGLSLVLRGGDADGLARMLADLEAVAHRERLVRIPLGTSDMRARVYAPAYPSRQTALVIAGLHPGGIDEPRLVALSRELAGSRVTVVTPDLPQLSKFEITPALTDGIEQAALWLAGNAELAPTGRIGLLGVSISGGLAIVAAGRPALRDRLSYVFALGAHDDLPRVLTYLCSCEAEDATEAALAPHDYGVAVVLLHAARRLVPPDQAGALEDAVRRYLRASYLATVDEYAAARELAGLREFARRQPEPTAGLIDAMVRRDVASLGCLLRPHVAGLASDAALSPARAPAPSAPVFLLHGRHDRIIPASETLHMRGRLIDAHVPVRVLLTDLIAHAETDAQPRASEVWRLGRFWGDLLARR